MTGHVVQFHLTEEDLDEALTGIEGSLSSGGYLIFESRKPNVRFWESGDHTSAWQRSKDDPSIRIDETHGEVHEWTEFIGFENNILEYKLYYHFVEQDKTVVSHDRLRFRTQEELTSALEKHGFTVEQVYGFWDKSPVTDDCLEFVFVARKK